MTMMEVTMMKTMNISSVDYHIRMLSDLATQNKGSLILVYDTGEKEAENRSIGACSVIGTGRSVLNATIALVKLLAKDAGIKPVEMLELMMEAITSKQEEKGYDEP